MKKILSLLISGTLIAVTSSNLDFVSNQNIICNSNFEIKNMAPRKNIAKIITNTNLGFVVFEKDIPTKRELLYEIQTNNLKATKKLTVDDFEFKDSASDSSVTIVGNKKYTGEVTLTYDTKTIDLREIIKVKSLGKIVFFRNLPSDQAILDAIKVKNPETSKLTIFNFIAKTKHENGALIKGSGKYRGEVYLSYRRGKTIYLHSSL